MAINGLLSRFTAAVFAILFCILILEFGLKNIGRGPNNTHKGIYEAYKDFYKLKKNIKKKIISSSGTYNIYTNSFGFRDMKPGDIELKNKPFYIFLGASDVFGDGMDYEKTFVGIFSDYASTKGIETLNMAVGGQPFIYQVMLLQDFINKDFSYYPKVVIFCFNDLNIPTFDWRNWKSNDIKVVNGDLFDSKGWILTYIKFQFENYSGTYCFLREKYQKLRQKLTSFRTSPYSEFLDAYSKTNRMHNSDTIDKFESYLKNFEDYCMKYGIIPVYVYMPLADSFRFNEILKEIGKDPEGYDTDYYENLMQRYCEKRKVQLIDLKPLLNEHYNEGRKLRFDLDAHYNIYTNKVIGEYIIKEIFHTDINDK